MADIKRINVIPNSKKAEVIKGEPLVVKVKAAPIKGKANKAVVKLLSKYFGKSVSIISGGKSKKKIVQIG
ncbi:DUF167 domain-containing protein [candidate division WOR-3 bacterium]|nr:DUF167 domain-containing protein [candidate division WOR-3 bacterium]